MFCYTKIYRCLSISIIIVSFVLSSCTSNNNSSSVCDTNQLECASAESLSDAAVFNESDSMGVHSSESTKYETGIKNNAFEEQLFDEIVIAVDFLTRFFDFNRDNRYEIINSSFTEAQGVITAVPSEPGIYTDTNAEKKVSDALDLYYKPVRALIDTNTCDLLTKGRLPFKYDKLAAENDLDFIMTSISLKQNENSSFEKGRLFSYTVELKPESSVDDYSFLPMPVLENGDVLFNGQLIVSEGKITHFSLR